MTPDFYAAIVGEKDNEPKCPMCGVPYSDHASIQGICRKYHRLRAEIRLVIEEWHQPVFHLNRVTRLQQALDAAENNEVTP